MTSTSSFFRPISGFAGVGRFVWYSVFNGGNSPSPSW